METLQKMDSPKVWPTTLTINGTKYVGNHEFTCGNSVPIYEVLTVHAFTQLIGHAKFNNQSFGNIYYRGECKLHDSLKPSLFRNIKNPGPSTNRLVRFIQKFIDDEYMQRELKLPANDPETSKTKVEGMLQHYGIPTRFVDVVDNHWIALWMGLNKADKPKQINQYYHYVERQVPLIEIVEGNLSGEEELFQYVLLLAIPFSAQRTFTGIQISDDYIEVDLRQALPSTFLRPHAQHGLVIRKFIDDEYMQRELKLPANDPETSKTKVEGMLQHYGIPTRFVDVVDNHWIALWMGLNKADKPKQINQYYHYVERQVPLIEIVEGNLSGEEELFQYVLLLAIPFSAQRTFTGIQISDDYIEVDLRQALPSTFLRPHAQHGLVIRRKIHESNQTTGTDAYDLAPAIVGIIKIRIDRVKNWIGTGELLTQNSLFPPAAYDYGYDLLLKRTDLFNDTEFNIAHFV